MPVHLSGRERTARLSKKDSSRLFTCRRSTKEMKNIAQHRSQLFEHLMKTTPDVFIIESLRLDDEEKQHSEGSFISHILRLAERQVRYYYIRTRSKLRLREQEWARVRHFVRDCAINGTRNFAACSHNFQRRQFSPTAYPVS